MAELAFFIGKGGVGKTTISSSYAAQWSAAHPRERVLLLSTDPAHSLADIFQIKLGDNPTRLRGKGALFLWQVNAGVQFQTFIKPYRDALLDLIESGTIFSRKEIEPLLETTLPGMAEVAALIAIDGLLAENKYDSVIVDTAPIGHTLRMFELPQHFARFLEFLDLAGSRDRWLAQRFGAKQDSGATGSLVEEWRTMVENVRSALTAARAKVFLVTSSEEFSLNESLRSADTMASSVPELAITGVVLNRAGTATTRCALCLQRAKMTSAAKRFVARNFRGVPLLVAEDAGGPILGATSLRSFGHELFRGKRVRNTKRGHPGEFPKLKQEQWPTAEAPLIFTMGKGGVGKTTISASLGFHKRTKKGASSVIVCSTDPAPSLDDIFQANITGKPKAVFGDRKFAAIEVDSVAEFRRWASEMQRKIDSALTSHTSGGVHVDMSFDRKIFSALLDIVPPGVDEIFAIFKILDLMAGGSKQATVIIDMAPTGHALELLRMPERMLTWSRLLLKSLAPHRTLPIAQDVAVQIAELGQRVRELVEVLKRPSRSAAYAVMLAEPLPDHQTLGLLKSLHEMRIGVTAVFVNRVLMNETDCPRCRSARDWQAATLNGLKKRYPGQTIYVLPEVKHEVAGKKALSEFTEKLWRLA